MVITLGILGIKPDGFIVVRDGSPVIFQNQPVEIMDEILQLRKNFLSDLLDKALRKIEQVLTRPVNTSMDSKSMYDAMDIKNTSETPYPVSPLTRIDSVPALGSQFLRDCTFLALLTPSGSAVCSRIISRDHDPSGVERNSCNQAIFE
jgi:hypothetical protein